MAAKQNMTAAEKVRAIRGAIGLFDDICVDGNFGEHNRLIARMYTQLSLYLWLDGKKTEAFDALDRSVNHFRQFETLCTKEKPGYTAPMLRLVDVDFSRSVIPDPSQPETTAADLYMSWPWWHVEEAPSVKVQMQADPRWDVWVRKCNS